jgi:signal peptidase I
MSKLNINNVEFTSLAVHILGEGFNLRFRASGKSMQPFILNGDVLEVEPCNGRVVQKGEIILCKTGERNLVAHRVVKIKKFDNKKLIFLRGDSNLESEYIVFQEQVLGHIVSIIRNNRRIRIDSTSQRLLVMLWNTFPQDLRKVYWRFFTSRQKMVRLSFRQKN